MSVRATGLSDYQQITCTNNGTDGRIVEGLLSKMGFPGATIPPLASLDRLQRLDLDTNGLVGTIPPLASLIRLQYLWLHNNSLTGPIPDMSGLVNLGTLVLYYNNLTGNIDGVLPPNVGTCTITYGETNQELYTCNSSYPAECNSVASRAQYFTKQTAQFCAAAAAAAASAYSTASDSPTTAASGAASTIASSGSQPTSTAVVARQPSTSTVSVVNSASGTSLSSTGASDLNANNDKDKKGSGILIPTVSAVAAVLVIGGALVAFVFVRRSQLRKEAAGNGASPTNTSPPGPYKQPTNTSMSLSTTSDTTLRKDGVSSQGSKRTLVSGGSNNGSQQISGTEDLMSESPHWTFMYFAGVNNKYARQIDLPAGSPVLWVEEEFVPNNSDEVAVRPGDQFKLRTAFRDGWGYGRNVETDEAGLLPLDHLRLGTEPQPPPSAYPYGRVESSMRFPKQQYQQPGSGRSNTTAYESSPSSYSRSNSSPGSGVTLQGGLVAPSDALPLIPSGVAMMPGYSRRQESPYSQAMAENSYSQSMGYTRDAPSRQYPQSGAWGDVRGPEQARR
ncbi:hypothetical protein HDU93_004725 [Gonapodya sp. JEL0774]|nr:hypothetical protein HDU93_004725 [Gonapodya sp. JEL0774]